MEVHFVRKDAKIRINSLKRELEGWEQPKVMKESTRYLNKFKHWLKNKSQFLFIFELKHWHRTRATDQIAMKIEVIQPFTDRIQKEGVINRMFIKEEPIKLDRIVIWRL